MSLSIRSLRACALSGLLAGVALLGAACSDDPAGPAPTTSCATSSDCDRGASTAGQVCIDGSCTACFTDTSCQGDAWYGAGSTCVEGRCSGCEAGATGCRCDGGSCEAAECVAGACVACERGDLGCVCLSNGACDAGASCQDGACGPCINGTEGCPCDNNACEGELVCQGGMCADADCTTGAEGCPCADGDACEGELLCGDDGVCRACAPDVEGCPCADDGTCEGGLGCDEGTCVPCDPSLVGCPCAEDDTCEEGLICDVDDDACRAALVCEGVTCAPNQLCGEGAPGMDAACLEECLPGFAWDGAACVPDGSATTCEPGAEGSLADMCAGLNRACAEQDGAAMCAACLDGFTDADMTLEACRATLTCADTDCSSEQRVCVEASGNADAVCGMCLPGYSEQGGVCVAGATCAPNDAGSIASECAALSRACDEPQPGQASCGDCLTGFVEDAPGGACREPIACADRVGPLACPPGAMCYDLGSAMDSECRTRACANPREASPPPPAALSCALCTAPATCDIEGQTGELDTWRTANNQCVCITELGYFADLSEDGAAKRCDRDGDGWLNLNGYQATQSSDPVIRANARCTTRTVDRVVLQNEWGQRRDVYACEGATPWSLTPCAGPRRLLPLVEPAALDDVDAFNAVATQEGTLPAYTMPGATGARGRRLRVEELNPLTKACVDRFGDFNANKRADFTEHQTQAADTTLAAELRAFVPFAAFVELHRFSFEPVANFSACPMGHACGQLVIAERSRAEVGFAVQPEAGANEYWRDCTRGRDASYAEDAGSAAFGELSGFDFGRFNEGCGSNVGGCAIAPPPVPLQPVAVPPPHGLRDVTLPLPINAVYPWRGMTHHSQFKCISLDNDINPATPGRERAQQRLSRAELYNGANAGAFVLNRCGVACPDADLTCATDCAGDTCATSSEAPAQAVDPRAPRLRCEALDSSAEVDSLPSNTVGFAAVRYIQGNGSRALPRQDYLRGCINEWDPQTSAATVSAWRSLCPGYIEAPRATFGLADVDQYGKILCGCDVNFGGPTCQMGCEDPMFGGAASSPCTDNNAYCPVKPGDDGGRLGAWICGEFTATSLPNDAPPFLQEGPALLEGNINLKARPSQPMCEGGGDCARATGPVVY